MPRTQVITAYADIDWQSLWHNARAGKSWKSRAAKDWSERADSFAERVIQAPYVGKVLEHLDIDRTTTVLDVGCGPGTLALPLAEMAGSVTALDYSDGMLNRLRTFARERHLTNIRTLRCAWEDDWAAHGIGEHDIAIASRSLNIDNLVDGISKLNEHATRRVYVVERIAPTPFDPDAFAAIGRSFNSGPDYIYTLNTLYAMGIHPRVEQIELETEGCYRDLDQALQRYRWMFKELSNNEEERLAAFLTDRIVGRTAEHLIIASRFPQRWALISWNTQKSRVKNDR